MKIYFLSIFIIVLVSILAVTVMDDATGNVVINKDPCRLVKCNVLVFGFWHFNAEWIDTTPYGYAVCHCPQDRQDVVYYVKIQREY